MATFSFGAKQGRQDDGGEEGGGKRKAPAFTFGGAASKPAAPGGFSFGGSTPAASPKGAAPAFAFGSSGGAGESSDEKKAAPAFSFGSSGGAGASSGAGDADSTKKPAFSFGGSGGSGGASTGFSFGAKPAASSSGGCAFKAAPPAATDDGGDGGDGEDEAPDPDQKPEVSKSAANENEEVIDWIGSEARAALHTLTDTKQELEDQLGNVQKATDEGIKDGMTLEEAKAALEEGKKAKFKQWKKRGVSTVALVKDKTSGNVLIRMRSENGQQLLLNDWAHKTKTTKLADKKLTMITADAKSHMLRFGKQETRDELFECAFTIRMLLLFCAGPATVAKRLCWSLFLAVLTRTLSTFCEA